MNLETLFYCALSGGLLAYGLGCSSDSEPPGKPILPDFESYSYSVMEMANGHPQVYGSTQYQFVMQCHGSILEVHNGSSADAVWFDSQVTAHGDQSNNYDVTITPGQDEQWSAKVTFRCEAGNKKSGAVVVNFCHNGPCSDEDKP